MPSPRLRHVKKLHLTARDRKKIAAA
jgi:hypothetical protein